QLLRNPLASFADLGVARRNPVADRNQKVLAGEQVGLAQYQPVVHHGGGFGYDKQGVSIEFQFRALMSLLGVFDREFMETELFLNSQQQGLVWLPQANPHKHLWVLNQLPDLFNRHLTDALPLTISNTVYDLRHGSLTSHGCSYSERQTSGSGARHQVTRGVGLSPVGFSGLPEPLTLSSFKNGL